MKDDLLLTAGLSLREAQVYRTLLKQGELTASEVANISGLIRTNAYDVLNSLVNKGIVTYTIRNNKKYFHSTDPEKLVEYIDSQKENLEKTKIEVLRNLTEFKRVDSRFHKPLMEIYEGKEGLKTILAMSIRETIKTRKEVLGISVKQQKCRQLVGTYHVKWYKEREKNRIKSRYIVSSDESIIPVKYTQFKRLPKEAKDPSEIFIFGDVTSQFFFVSGFFTAMVIKNKEITDSYRDYFDFLWGVLQ